MGEPIELTIQEGVIPYETLAGVPDIFTGRVFLLTASRLFLKQRQADH